MKKIVLFAAVLQVCVFMSGCASTPGKFTYPVKGEELTRLSATPLFDKSVIVYPFADERGEDSLMLTGILALVPFVPCGWMYQDRPEIQRSGFEFSPVNDLAMAAAVSLKHSNLFKSVTFADSGRKNEGFVLEGKIKSTRFSSQIFTYGFSLYGIYLWVTGLPFRSSGNTLKFQLYLKKNGKTLWTYSCDDSKMVLHGLYYNWGREEVAGYAQIMQACMNQAVKDMEKKLRGNPDFWFYCTP